MHSIKLLRNNLSNRFICQCIMIAMVSLSGYNTQAMRGGGPYHGTAV